MRVSDSVTFNFDPQSNILAHL